MIIGLPYDAFEDGYNLFGSPKTLEVLTGSIRNYNTFLKWKWWFPTLSVVISWMYASYTVVSKSNKRIVSTYEKLLLLWTCWNKVAYLLYLRAIKRWNFVSPPFPSIKYSFKYLIEFHLTYIPHAGQVSEHKWILYIVFFCGVQVVHCSLRKGDKCKKQQIKELE